MLSAYPIEDRSIDTFCKAQKDYLKKIAGVTNITDFVIHALEQKQKPAALPFKDYHKRRAKFKRHLDS